MIQRSSWIASSRSASEQCSKAAAEGTLGQLWRPNETVSIVVGTADLYDALIARVRYSQNDRDGSRTDIEVVGREAYDREPLPDQHRRHGHVSRAANVANTTGSSGRHSP